MRQKAEKHGKYSFPNPHSIYFLARETVLQKNGRLFSFLQAKAIINILYNQFSVKNHESNMQALVYSYKFKNQLLYKVPSNINYFCTDVQKKNPVDCASTGFLGATCWTRTNDPAVNSRMLYRLSY